MPYLPLSLFKAYCFKLFMKKKETIFLFIILGVSILARGLNLLTPTLAGDETSVGLMGLRVMKGDFPVFYYGQNFMGSLEAFLAGSFFQVFGASPRTLELLPAIFSILFLLLLYRLSKTFFDYQTALISMALLSIPPFFLLGWSHEARLHYHFAIIFGNFLLLISHQLVSRKISPEKKRLLFLILGLLSGIAWWTNYLIITYLLPVGLFLFLRDKKVLFKKNFLFLLFMFLVGSLPLWIFNVIHQFPIAGIAGLADRADIISYLKNFFSNAFPILLGFLPPLSNDKFDLTAYLIIGPLYGLAIMYYGYRFRAALKATLSLRLTQLNGGEILFFLFLITILINLLTIYGTRLSDDDQKYLLPLYTCLPIFVSVLLVDLSKKFFFPSLVLFGLIVFSNLAGNLRHDGWIIFSPEKIQAYQKYIGTENCLIDFLIKNGHTRSTCYGRPGPRLTFKSKEVLISVHPYRVGCLKHADLVDAAFYPSYLSEGEDKVFEENLKAIGGSYRKMAAPGGYFVYTDFNPPQSYRMIPRDLWTGTSNVQPLGTQNAFDGDITTGWGTLGPQKKGTYFLLDLGRVETVGKISYVPAIYYQVPVGYRVALSVDSQNWQVVSEVQGYRGPTFWSGRNPMTKVRHGRVETVFPPQPCRFLKISLLHDSNDTEWSINELFLFGPDDIIRNNKNRIPDGPEIDHLLTFLKARGIHFVYADHWLSAVIRVKSEWKIKTIISNYFTGDNGEDEPPTESLERTHLDRKVSIVVKKENLGLEKILQESRHSYRKKEVGPFMVYYDFSTSDSPPPLPIKNWKVSSNANPQDAEKAIDRNPATRWSSGKPQEPGIYYQIDLNEVRSVKGCSLFLGKSIKDYPRLLRLFSSLDGNSWQEITTTAESGLYWTGETLQKMTATRFFFSPVQLRYLRLLQEGQDPVYYWSIHELELF